MTPQQAHIHMLETHPHQIRSGVKQPTVDMRIDKFPLNASRLARENKEGLEAHFRLCDLYGRNP